MLGWTGAWVVELGGECSGRAGRIEPEDRPGVSSVLVGGADGGGELEIRVDPPCQRASTMACDLAANVVKIAEPTLKLGVREEP